MEWDEYRLDTGAYRLERLGEPVPLEPKAFDVLELLVSQPGRLLTKQEIFDTVWPDTAVTDHALTRVIAQLRKALGDHARETRYIETVPTRGYRWAGPAPRVENARGGDRLGSTNHAPPAAGDGSVDGRVRDAGRDGRRSRGGAGLFVWLGAALVALAAVSATVWFLRDHPPSVAQASAWGGSHAGAVRWPQQVTTHAGLDLTPAMSPRGDALAFASDRSGAFEIYVRALGSGALEVPLTSDAGQNVQPAWSPDGTQLAFHSAARGGVWVMPARGGTPRQVVAEGSQPAWAPDGRTLAYQTDEHADITPSAFGAQAGSTLWLVDADGLNPRALTTSGEPLGGHAAPAWSPDGRYVAFATFDGGSDMGAWIISVADRRVRRLTESPRLYELVFAPDGSAVYAAGGDALVYRIPFDATAGRATGPVEPLPVAGVPGVRGLSISGDGRRLAFSGMALDSQIWAQPLTADGRARGEAYALTKDTSRRNWMAVVSPDGSRVAYMSTRRGDPPNVWLMNADGTGKTQLTADEYGDGKPTWYRDGTRLAYFSFRNGRSGLWAIDTATRRETLVWDSATAGGRRELSGRVAEIELAPSMTHAAFSVVTTPHARRRVYVSALDPLEPRPVHDERAWVGYPVWSPDERRLAVELKDGGSTHAAVIDVATGALRQLTHERGQTWVRSWSPDGSRIAAATLRDGRWSLRWIDAASGAQVEMLAPVTPGVYVRYPDWSQRRDLVVFERGELRGNIWTLPLQ